MLTDEITYLALADYLRERVPALCLQHYPQVSITVETIEIPGQGLEQRYYTALFGHLALIIGPVVKLEYFPLGKCRVGFAGFRSELVDPQLVDHLEEALLEAIGSLWNLARIKRSILQLQNQSGE